MSTASTASPGLKRLIKAAKLPDSSPRLKESSDEETPPTNESAKREEDVAEEEVSGANNLAGAKFC